MEYTNDYIKQFITGSSLDLDGIEVIQNVVQNCKPQTILELGSGVSTLAFAQIHASFDFMFSVDDSDEYLNISRSRIPKELQLKIRFIHAPISNWNFKGRSFNTYNYDAIHRAVNRPIDLLFIDGPYARSFGRVSTLPLVYRLLNNKCIVILDDAERDTEVEALFQWQKIWGGNLKILNSYSYRKGLKILQLDNPKKTAFAPFGLNLLIRSIFS